MGDPMSCIFFDGEICLAQRRTIKKVQLVKPAEAHRRKYCQAQGYGVCPRYVSYVTHLKKAKEIEEAKP